MTKNGVYFIVIALLVVELFEILFYASWMTCDVTLLTRNDAKIITKYGISVQILSLQG